MPRLKAVDLGDNILYLFWGHGAWGKSPSLRSTTDSLPSEESEPSKESARVLCLGVCPCHSHCLDLSGNMRMAFNPRDILRLAVLAEGLSVGQWDEELPGMASLPAEAPYFGQP